MQKHIDDLRAALNAAKPNDRSEDDRRIAILLTELEKLEALGHAWKIILVVTKMPRHEYDKLSSAERILFTKRGGTIFDA